MYSEEIISYIDDFLGSLEIGDVFNEAYFNSGIRDIRKTEKILNDLVSLQLLAEDGDSIRELEEENSDMRNFELLVEPKKRSDENYEEYRKNKRYIDSFSIIFEKSQRQKSGALVLLDLKGYSKNMNKGGDTSIEMILLIKWIKETIDEEIAPYFLNAYSGIEIKQNGDSWFLYFLREIDAYSFLSAVMRRCSVSGKIQDRIVSMGSSLKGYIHHAQEVDSIYRVDTIRFDVQGRDVILIHMLEKPIESRLYDGGIITKSTSFIAITDSVYTILPKEIQVNFIELTGVNLSGKSATDSEGNSKIYDSGFKIFYHSISSESNAQF